MNEKQRQLDALFQRARETAPVISPDAARAFVTTHARQTTRPYTTNTRIHPTPIIITGGVMAVLTILVLLFGLFQDAPPYQQIRQPNETSARQSESGQTEDRPASQDSYSDSSEQVLPRPHMHAPTAHSRTGVDDSLEHARRNALFAAWTSEQIQSSTVLVLDSIALRRIGLSIGPDSTVYFHHPDTNPKSWIVSEGMKEHPDKGYVTYTLTFTHPDSVRKAGVGSDANGDGHRGDATHCAPVLVTNSRGQTFTRLTSKEKGEKDPDVGSGKYAGKELVAVRVWSAGPATRLMSDTEDYYYLYWFEPSKEFLDALPADARRSVERARGMEPSSNEAPVPARPIALVGTSMHPNPATSDDAMVEYTLTEERRVAVTVYDITGTRLREVAVSDTRASGTWRENVSFEGIPNGYYLLAVTTDLGERNIRPFILKR